MKNRTHRKDIALGSIISMVGAWIGWAIFIAIDQIIVLSQNVENFNKSYFITNFFIGCFVILIPSLFAGFILMKHLIHEIEMKRMSFIKAFFKGGLFGFINGFCVCILVWIVVALIATHRSGLNYQIFLIRSLIGMIISTFLGGIIGCLLFKILIDRLNKVG